jgi:hypothetical protein
MDDKPRPPRGLKPAGRRLFLAIVRRYELDPAELAILVEMCRTVDHLEALDAAVQAGGVVGEDGKVAPALVEARMQQQTLAKLAASLRIPDGQPAGASVSDAAGGGDGPLEGTASWLVSGPVGVVP